MRCPYCNEKMRRGYIQSARQIFWGEKKHKISFTPSRDGEINISDGLLCGATAEASYCEKCKKFIIELQE